LRRPKRRMIGEGLHGEEDRCMQHFARRRDEVAAILNL
jgi:hypothetical protein